MADTVLALLDGVDEMLVAKGKNIQRYDLGRERPDDDGLRGLMLGRSGKLRAPAIRQGSRFVVGYNQEILPATLE